MLRTFGHGHRGRWIISVSTCPDANPGVPIVRRSESVGDRNPARPGLNSSRSSLSRSIAERHRRHRVEAVEATRRRQGMYNIFYVIGVVVVVLALLSLVGLA